jgi:flagellar motor switch/type III secretory pathway protein FliN
VVVDQAEIDALLAQAAAGSGESAWSPEPAAAPAPPRAPALANGSPAVRRILRIRVPVIVQLARRSMMIVAIRKLAPGSIIEFSKSVAEFHDLMINNRPIGRGKCVKIGEHFGLQIMEVLDRTQRIRSLGPQE